METIYLAGGCLWGVQYFMDGLTGIVETEAGRANGSTQSLDTAYDGYAECVKIDFDSTKITVTQLMDYLFEIIDPYSVNQQGNDIGLKYRTGVYSEQPHHLEMARAYINAREDRDQIRVEVLPLTNYVKSAPEHQHHLARHPEDYTLCHIPWDLMMKYKNNHKKGE
ncbi:MAG: peptide-methionine (S)-S-oxide reductase [Aerococcaceae bacterium]|nr:peptide-methionine (S)-S-oxide reductase [Aerococcaceae bacterium]